MLVKLLVCVIIRSLFSTDLPYSSWEVDVYNNRNEGEFPVVPYDLSLLRSYLGFPVQRSGNVRVVVDQLKGQLITVTFLSVPITQP